MIHINNLSANAKTKFKKNGIGKFHLVTCTDIYLTDSFLPSISSLAGEHCENSTRASPDCNKQVIETGFKGSLKERAFTAK